MKTLPAASLSNENTPSTKCDSLHDALRLVSQSGTAPSERKNAEELVCRKVRIEVLANPRLGPWDANDLAHDVAVKILTSAREGKLPSFVNESGALAFVRAAFANRRNDHFRKVNGRAKKVVLGIDESNEGRAADTADRPGVGDFKLSAARTHIASLARTANRLAKNSAPDGYVEAALAIAFDERELSDIIESNRSASETQRKASNRVCKRMQRARDAILKGAEKIENETDRDMLVEFFRR